MTKFKSQALHIIAIKYWKASGSGNPPSLIPALRKIAILGLKMKFYVLFLHPTVDAEGSLQIILPTQNSERAYYFDKESEVVWE